MVGRALVASLVLAAMFGNATASNTTSVASVKASPKAVLKPVTSFGYLDINKDARLSRDEAKADWAVKQSFSQVDANSDGYLDKEEFEHLSRGS